MAEVRLAAVLLLGLAGAPGGLGLDVTVTSDEKINCGACKGLFDELDYHISKVPAYKVIELGDQSGLRVGAKREQKPYARSEVHLTELLDGKDGKVCVEMKNYSGFTDDQNRTIYHRYQNRPEEHGPLKLKHFGWSVVTQDQLRLACDIIAAEIEEELVESYQAETEVDLKIDTCMNYCEKADMKYLLNPWFGLDEDGNAIEDTEYVNGRVDAAALRVKNQKELDNKAALERREKRMKKKKKEKKAKKKADKAKKKADKAKKDKADL